MESEDKRINQLGQISNAPANGVLPIDVPGSLVTNGITVDNLAKTMPVATDTENGAMPSSYFENGKFKLIYIEYNVPVRIGRVRGMLLLQAPWRAVELSMFLITRIGIVTIHDSHGHRNLLSLDSEGYLVWIENEPTHRTIRCWFQELNLTEI